MHEICPTSEDQKMESIQITISLHQNNHPPIQPRKYCQSEYQTINIAIGLDTLSNIFHFDN